MQGEASNQYRIWKVEREAETNQAFFYDALPGDPPGESYIPLFQRTTHASLKSKSKLPDDRLRDSAIP